MKFLGRKLKHFSKMTEQTLEQELEVLEEESPEEESTLEELEGEEEETNQ